MAVLAGPDGPHESTLLLVFGDHGQARASSAPRWDATASFSMRRLDPGLFAMRGHALCCVAVRRRTSEGGQMLVHTSSFPQLTLTPGMRRVQTLGGDHGGGTPDEVETALVAVDLRALHALRGSAEGPPQRPAGMPEPVPIMQQVRC
jgi:hypothetical protein